MENLLLWIGSTVGYFVVYTIYMLWCDDAGAGYWRHWRRNFVVIALLAFPVNINGHVFTVLGNAVGEKTVWSVASLYQRASESTFAFFAPFTYQDAGPKGSAISIVGVPSVQSGNMSGLFFGIAPYQHANVRPADVIIGVAGHQESLQAAQVTLGIAFHQRVGERERWFGAFAPLKANDK